MSSRKMKDYDIEFTQEELDVLNNMKVIQNKKDKIMSVYYSLIKNSEDDQLSISVAELYKKHKNSKSGKNKKLKMSLAYFKRLISELEEVGLVVIDKTNKRYKYFIFRKVSEKVSEKVAEKVSKKKVMSDLEITSLEGNDESLKAKKENNYTYTLNTKPSDFVSTSRLVKIGKEIMKELRVKSAMVKNLVISKLEQARNINSVGAVAYVTKVISEKKGIAEANREFYYRNLNRIKMARKNEMQSTFAKNNTNLRFNNFEAREHYQDQEYMDYLEKQLTGLA